MVSALPMSSAPLVKQMPVLALLLIHIELLLI